MTDLNERLAAMLDNEPPAPYDIDRVVTDGRRALRRRTTLTAVAGVAGTAAVTTMIVVPITMSHSGGGESKLAVLSSPTAPTEQPEKCRYYLRKEAALADQEAGKDFRLEPTDRQLAFGVVKKGDNLYLVCPDGATVGAEPDAEADPTTSMPRYDYTEEPQAIADRFGNELSKQVKRLGFEVAYTRPFAQESAELEKGHPSYYGGNVDVRLSDGLADIGVQVTHGVTELVPFDGDCDPATCTRSTLPDGSLMQISRIDAGSGGAEVVTVDVHHPDGLVVSAQMSNYGFGPDATRDRTKHQPLTLKQLTQLARNPAWTF